MIILKTFAEKKNLLLISLLIILISLLTSICYGANSDYLKEYLQSKGVLNQVINTNLNNTITFDDLCDAVDTKNVMCVSWYQNSQKFYWIYLGGYWSGNGNPNLTINMNGITTKSYRISYMWGQTGEITEGNTYNSSLSTSCINGFVVGPYQILDGVAKGVQNNITIFNFNGATGQIMEGIIDNSLENNFLIANMNVGINISTSDLHFYLFQYDSLNSGDESLYILNQELIGYYIDTDTMNNFNCYADKSLINQTSDYIIRVYDGQTLIGQSEGAYIVVESSSGGGGSSGGTIVVPSGDSGQITTPSGENGGNVDLTGVQNRLDGVNQNLGVVNESINQLPEKIGNTFYNSGDSSGEKGIIQKVYDDLFTVDDNFLEEKIDELGLEMGISGDLLKESTELVLSVYDESKKGDFIISWSPFYLEDVLMIPSGDVNFSKIERDVPAVQDLMFWVRLILSFSCFGLLIRQIWFLILSTLGVTTSIYEDHIEEENALIGQTYETISTSNVQDGVRTTISHRRKLGK